MTPNHLSAMGKIAANIGKQPYTAPAEPQVPDNGQRAALRFVVGTSATGEVTCYWTIRYPDRAPNQKHPIHSFPLNGMKQEEILDEIVKRSLLRITEYTKEPIRVAVQQEKLREAYLKAHGNHKIVIIINDESAVANQLNTAAMEHLKKFIFDMRSTREKAASVPDRAKELKLSGASTARTVYVDASYFSGTETMGYGYIIKDVYSGAGENAKRWHLSYGSATGITSTDKDDDATGAELRAIRDVLRLPGVLNDDVQSNHRSLFIATDSRWSVSILTALRDNKQQTHFMASIKNAPYTRILIRDDWMNTAQEIIESLKGIETVTFQWVRGHNGDPLNEAADRLAKSARINLEREAPEEKRREIKDNIMYVTKCVLARQGITAEVEEDPSSMEKNC